MPADQPPQLPHYRDVIERIRSETDFRAVFYMLSGKPSTQTKFFQTPSFVDANGLASLNNQVFRKLETHQLEGSFCTVSVILTDRTVLDFGSWNEFEDHDWSVSVPTERIVLRWEFMLNMDRYEIPQKHTVTVRIGSEFRSSDFIQALISQQFDSTADVDFDVSPAYCRVDFLNQSLGEELLSLVGTWYDAQASLPKDPVALVKLRRWRRTISHVVFHSVPVSVFLLSASIFFGTDLFVSDTHVASSTQLKLVAVWVAMTLVLVAQARSVIWRSTEQLLHHALFHHRQPPFGLTKGDENRQEKFELARKTDIRSVMTRVGLLIAYDVIIVVASWLILS